LITSPATAVSFDHDPIANYIPRDASGKHLSPPGRARLADFHADLDTLLADRPFVAGETYSVADITARVTLDFAAVALNLPPPPSAAAIARWYEALSARPSTDA
jgi:glutathione S-transferase